MQRSLSLLLLLLWCNFTWIWSTEFLFLVLIETGEGATHTQGSVKRGIVQKGSKRAAALPVDSFYLGGRHPEGLPYLPANTVDIGQMLEDGSGPYYATRYNTFNHIPVYSAYTVNPQQAVKLGTVTLKRPKFFETPGLCSKVKLILCITYRLKLICIIFVEQYNAQNTVPLVYLEMAIVKVIITIPHQSINQSTNQSSINSFIHPPIYMALWPRASIHFNLLLLKRLSV